MKKVSVTISLLICTLLLTACADSSSENSKPENAKSDALACKNMNADYMTGIVGNSTLGNASERVQLVADEILEASKSAESSLLVNIMEDNAKSMEKIAVLADDSSTNEFVLNLVADKLFAVIDACESAR